jgi:hypothetical protein
VAGVLGAVHCSGVRLRTAGLNLRRIVDRTATLPLARRWAGGLFAEKRVPGRREVRSQEARPDKRLVLVAALAAR